MSYSSIIEIKKQDIKFCSDIFFKHILSNSEDFQNLIESSKNCDLLKELRPTMWKIFLGILPKNNSNIVEWVEILSKMRDKYNKKKKKYFSIKKYKGDPLGINNNSENKKSERDFNRLYEENELRRIINLDIIRTYQNINLFSQENIKKILLNILFIWSKDNSDVSYRQGMNDLLAILLLCLYPYYFQIDSNEKISKEDIIKIFNLKESKDIYKYSIKIYNYFHDENDLECDLFYLFDSLMNKGMKELFEPKIIQKNDKDYYKYEIFKNIYKDEFNDEKTNYITRRCFLLIHEKLKIIDEELYNYFKIKDINCGAFLQKWFRCILCREFDLDQVFILWDAVLVNDYINEKNQKYYFFFIDSVCLAMLIRLRKYILNADQNDCFSLLFKYPKIDNIKNLIILSYNIYQFIELKIQGKDIDPKRIINVADNLSENEENILINNKNSNNNNNIKVYYTNEYLRNKESYNKLIENKNNNGINSINNNEIKETSFINGAMSSLGKIGNKLKDQLIAAKDVILNLELSKEYEFHDNNNNEINNINYKKENKMSDLFDIPDFQKEKDIENNKLKNNINNNEDKKINKNIINIIKRLEKLDNKYNNFFSTEDKNELKDIIKELST